MVAPPSEPTARQLATATSVKTASGATLQAPSGWWLSEQGDVLRLEDPEHTLKLWLVEAREPDAAKAIASAWQRVTPGFALPLDGELDVPPPSDGWDAIANVAYETTGDRVVSASAHRFGAITHVALVDGTRASLSRRGPQVEDAIATLKPIGMADESFAGRAPLRIDAARAKQLDQFIDTALARLEVPGAAIAVIQDGSVVYERGFGVRVLGNKAPVTANTLFMIGSITKSLTTAMQASLVDAKLFDWTTPVVSLLPSFALGDPELTKNLLVWHTTCACTGMPRSDLENIFEYGSVTAEQRLAAMKTMKPTTRLGETFQYSNLMVTAGGYIAAHAFAPKVSLDTAYVGAMRKQIFEPVRMTSTTFDFAVALRGDHAMPHAAALDGAIRAVPIELERNVIPIRPAGGIWSNVRDMERYVLMELAGGVAAGKRVVSEANLGARRIRRVGVPKSGYGLGLGVGEVHGVPVLEHDGGAMGFGASMFMLPEQRIGIIVLTNVRNGAPNEHLPFNVVVKRRVLEAIFDAKPLAEIQLAYFAKGKASAVAKVRAQVEFIADPRLAKVTGTYVNDSLGTVTLTAAGDGLQFDVGEWKRLVRPIKTAGALTLIHVEPPFAGAAFTIDDPDGAPTFTLTYEQTSYRFTRR